MINLNYLQVALIFGISGACRKHELVNIKVGDIEKQGDLLVVQIPETKTNKSRFFTVCGTFTEIVQKYIGLRPKHAVTNRFFLNYQKGKCTIQVIGENKFAKMPKEIATFLKLPDAELYTGHSFRRSSATLLADSGAPITAVKRLGGWKSTAVAEGYIEESVQNSAKRSSTILSAIDLPPNFSKKYKDASEIQFQQNLEISDSFKAGPSTSHNVTSHVSGQTLKFENCNVTINYN